MKSIPCPLCGRYGQAKSLNMAYIISHDLPGLCMACEKQRTAPPNPEAAQPTLMQHQRPTTYVGAISID